MKKRGRRVWRRNMPGNGRCWWPQSIFSRAGKKAWFLILPHCLMSMSTSDGELLVSRIQRSKSVCLSWQDLRSLLSTRIPWSEDPWLPITTLSVMLENGFSTRELSLTDGLKRYGTKACLPWLLGGLFLASLTKRLHQAPHYTSGILTSLIRQWCCAAFSNNPPPGCSGTTSASGPSVTLEVLSP